MARGCLRTGHVGASQRNTLQVPWAPRRGEYRHFVGECARPLRDKKKNALAEDRSGGRGVVAGAFGVTQRISQKVNIPRASRSWTSSLSSQFIHTCRSAQKRGVLRRTQPFPAIAFLVNRFASTSSTFPWVIHWCCSKNRCGQAHATNK